MESYEESSEDDMISTNDSVSSESSRCLYIDSFEKITAYLKEHAKEKDLIITVGAGPVNKIAKDLVESN